MTEKFFGYKILLICPIKPIYRGIFYRKNFPSFLLTDLVLNISGPDRPINSMARR